MEQSWILALSIAIIAAGTPLLFATLGELITEKVGVLNLSAEGTMSLGAVVGFITTYHSASSLYGVIAAALVTGLFALVFAFFALNLYTNQVATGLAMSILGVGLAAFIGKPYENMTIDPTPVYPVPFLSEIPVFGAVLFSQQPIIYFSWLVLLAISFFLAKTKYGLVVQAIGESPQTAYKLGYSVLLYRYSLTVVGGMLTGIGGAFLSVFYTPLWVEGIVAGRGWIALALVVFAAWRPFWAIFGTYLFGGISVAQLFVQGSGLSLNLPPQFLAALPYLTTIVVLILISLKRRRSKKIFAPLSLGKTFHQG